MKKQRLEEFNKMVEQHTQYAADLCKMAGLNPDECCDFFVPPANDPTSPSVSPEEQPRSNGKWLRKLWPF